MRVDRSSILRRAWQLARQGARRWGGRVRTYFAWAMRQAWVEARLPRIRRFVARATFLADRAFSLLTVVCTASTFLLVHSQTAAGRPGKGERTCSNTQSDTSARDGQCSVDILASSVFQSNTAT